jgi:hypothetical protein
MQLNSLIHRSFLQSVVSIYPEIANRLCRLFVQMPRFSEMFF